MLEKGFDMKNLIEKRLLEIDNLEERELVRKMLLEIFDELGKYTSVKYQQLEEKILSQIMDSSEEYTVITGIIEKSLYDPTQDFLYPIIPEDLDSFNINLDEMLASLASEGRYKVQTIFLEADYITIKKIINCKGLFYATIYTAEDEYTANIVLEQNSLYKEQIHKLYEVFLLNGVPWRPVCVPYLYKMYDIYLGNVDLPEDSQIERIVFHFGEYEKYIKYNMLPLWNFEKIQLTTDIRPEPCEDKIHYVHYINNRRLKEGKKYLVAETDGSVIDVLHEDGIGIVTLQRGARRWNLYQISNKMLQKTKYPVFHNHSNNKEKVNNRTTGGIFRFVNALQYSEYVKLKNISFPPQAKETLQTYSMDVFMQFEAFSPNPGKNMQLEFECLKQDEYIYDIVSYLVTAVQYEYREFYCTAALEQGRMI